MVFGSLVQIMIREYGHLYLVIVLLCGEVSALSNLDVREPIVKMSPALDQDNFGFSVVMHHVELPTTGDFDSFINSTKIVVGAPRGTYPGGLFDLPELEPEPFTGLVYICDVASPGNCSGLLSNEGNVSHNDRRLFDGDPNSLAPPAENKSEQLMGSFLSSNGEFFLACAPRWVTDPEISFDIDARRPIGRCFVSTRSLQGFQLVQPCTGMRESNPGPNVNADNQCLAGFSGAFINTENSGGFLALGAVGDNLFNGNLFYYNISSTSADLNSRTESFRSTQITSLYDAYSTTVGFITSMEFEDVISGIPRFDATTLSGGVRIRSHMNYTQDFVLNVTGLQTGEYFGFSVAAADLNNDGFDELIVGAPIYSDYSISLQENGRVFVYENTCGNLSTNPIILFGRNIVLARFGTAIVNLEDVNGDGYEDIAVGSPYEANGDSGNTGGVYIYYGKSSADGLISRSPDQVILGDDIVNNVPDVQSVRTFGYSLFSGVDVDGNQVNDLLIGAYESQMAVLIRSLSVANVDVASVNASNMSVSIDTTGDMFLVGVCATFNGTGFDGRRLDTTLNVSEVVSENVPRLFFVENDQSKDWITTTFTFLSPGNETCMNVMVFVKNVSALRKSALRRPSVNLRSPLEVAVKFSSMARPEPRFINGNPADLIDLRTIPVLIVEGTTRASVTPLVGCSMNQDMMEVCNPDLTVTLLNITYRDNGNNIISEGKAVAGIVQTINIHLRYTNTGEDPAFGARLTFNLPERLSYVRVDPSSLSISCLLNDSSSLYVCPLPNFILQTEETEITLVWRIRGEISGSEMDDISMVNIGLTSGRDVEADTSNNDLIGGPIIVDYAAVSDLSVTRVEFTINPNTYRGVSFTQTPQAVDEIGQKVQLTVTVRSGGPSSVSNTTLEIFIPTNDTEGSYYLYLFDIFSMSDAVCDRSPLNPDNLADPTGSRRRKRMARILRQETTTPSPQTTDISDGDQIRNCSRSTTACTKLECRIRSNFRVLTFDVEAYLDERFFQSQEDPFVFVAYARVKNNADFFEDPDQGNNGNASPLYRVISVDNETGSFPIWIPIVCGIVAVFFIILLFVLLYFVGFFRRKKMEDSKEAEGDFVPPEGANEKTTPEKVEITEAHVELADEEIGDVEDLQDGDTTKPDVDPEETSI